ncbi:MAG: hypothetical protein CMB80_34255 [Flammeovirgaceae bacterium]|nr:hypothetical protein [Flammeovirgaceae bacterium]HCX22874.1 hypothetical protein [Cytophagales bacterium]
MEITLKDGSGWSNWKESFPNKLVDEVLIVFNLESDRLESINDYCLQEKIQSEAVHTDCSLTAGVIYLISESLVFNCNGSRIHIQHNQLEIELMELMLVNYPQGSISLMDDRFYIVYTSGMGYDDHGLDPKSVNGLNIKQLWLPETYNEFIDSLERIKSGLVWEFESYYEDRDYLTSVSYISNGTSQYYLLKSKDITERRKSDIALLESEQRYRYFLDQSHEVICTHDARGNYKLISPAIKQLLGYEPEEMIGKHPYDFTHPDDKLILRESAWTKMMRGEQPENIQYRAIKKDGTVIWVDSYAEVVTDSKGEVISLTTASRDITDLKHIEIELRNSEKRFRGIADNLPGVIYLCLNDESYSMIYLNDEVKRLTGYPKEKFIAGEISFVDLYHPEDSPQIISKVDDALANQEPFHITYRLRNVKTDNWVWVEEYGQGIYEDGQLISLEGVLLDITSKLEDQLRLEQSQANLKAIFDSTQSIIGLYDTDNRLVEFNHSFYNYILATDGIELKKGMHIKEFITKERIDEYVDYHKRVLKGEKLKVTSEYPTPYGPIHLLSGLNPIYTKGEISGVSLFVEDITELKVSQRKLEEYAEGLEILVKERTKELETSNADLVRSNEQLESALTELQSTQDQLIQSEKMASLGVLSAGIAHEINNPMNFVKNGTAALFKRIKELSGYDNEEMQPYVELIEGGVERVSKIINSLSHFSRQVKTMDERCDLSTIIDNCLLILQARLIDRVEVVKSIDPECVVIGNEGKLHQALLNLLSNAEQAIHGQGTIKITGKSLGTLSELVIEDTGEGITKENLLKIGDPFFTTKPPGIGTGLGLFITYSIIEEHQGKIEVSSIVKNGTKIRIELPNL